MFKKVAHAISPETSQNQSNVDKETGGTEAPSTEAAPVEDSPTESNVAEKAVGIDLRPEDTHPTQDPPVKSSNIVGGGVTKEPSPSAVAASLNEAKNADQSETAQPDQKVTEPEVSKEINNTETTKAFDTPQKTDGVDATNRGGPSSVESPSTQAEADEGKGSGINAAEDRVKFA